MEGSVPNQGPMWGAGGGSLRSSTRNRNRKVAYKEALILDRAWVTVSGKGWLVMVRILTCCVMTSML